MGQLRPACRAAAPRRRPRPLAAVCFLAVCAALVDVVTGRGPGRSFLARRLVLEGEAAGYRTEMREGRCH